MSRTSYRAWVDGASRGNPGPASYGVFIEAPGGGVAAELKGALGKATNNVAEYRALIAALEWAMEEGVRGLSVCTDSLLLANQVNGEWKVRDPNLRALHMEVRALANRLDRFTIRHVPREKNRQADRLANEALDGRPKKKPGAAGAREEES